MTHESMAAVQPFLEVYERVHADQQWGADDLDLPFHPKRHQDIWNIRQRTFRAFQTIVAPFERGYGRCRRAKRLDDAISGPVGFRCDSHRRRRHALIAPGWDGAANLKRFARGSGVRRIAQFPLIVLEK
jgi:hypothetical protein